MRDKEWARRRPHRRPAQGLALGAQGSSLAASAGAASLAVLGGGVRATGVFGFFGGSAAGCCAAVAGVSSAASGTAALALMSLSAARHFWTLALCSLAVSANRCRPVPSATKKSSLVLAGLSTASMAARPGLQIGVGGNPSIW